MVVRGQGRGGGEMKWVWLRKDKGGLPMVKESSGISVNVLAAVFTAVLQYVTLTKTG